MNKPYGVWIKPQPGERSPKGLMLVTDGTNFCLVDKGTAIKMFPFKKYLTKYYMLIPDLVEDKKETLLLQETKLLEDHAKD